MVCHNTLRVEYKIKNCRLTIHLLIKLVIVLLHSWNSNQIIGRPPVLSFIFQLYWLLSDLLLIIVYNLIIALNKCIIRSFIVPLSSITSVTFHNDFWLFCMIFFTLQWMYGVLMRDNCISIWLNLIFAQIVFS